jgi:DNA modification methylase
VAKSTLFDKLSDIKAAPYNPRVICEDALVGLGYSIEEFGDLSGITVNIKTGNLVTGHQRIKAIKTAYGDLEIVNDKITLPTGQIFSVRKVDWPLNKEKAANIAANNQYIQGDWTSELGNLLEEVQVELPDLFDNLYFNDLVADVPEAEIDSNETEISEDEVPKIATEPVIQKGDLILLGKHRVLCGDSTNVQHVDRLMDGKKAQLVHADPPYGMGKEKDGVIGDNQYGAKLDAFQLLWWEAVRPWLDGNASVYIWGNAEDLWRLWFVGGLKDIERVTFRNEIVWDKGGGGMAVGTEAGRMYQSSERCLLFMLGEQGFSTNADNYWEGWEPIRKYLATQKSTMGWTDKWVATNLGIDPRLHWFSTSQWEMPTKEKYLCLQKLANGKAFQRDYEDLKREFYATRAYFDNAHENMTDVWGYKRVQGEERHGHATPKPVGMVARAIKSSCPENRLVVEPFLGSGSTLMACEQTNRICYGMELSEAYCQVIAERYINFVGSSEGVKVIRDEQELSWQEVTNE